MAAYKFWLRVFEKLWVKEECCLPPNYFWLLNLLALRVLAIEVIVWVTALIAVELVSVAVIVVLLVACTHCLLVS